jgi:serine phosphatase RsbU (regulator of sigma subunit)
VKKLSVIFFIVFYFAIAKGQQRQIDSLKVLISKTANDSLKLEYQYRICDVCAIKDNLRYGTEGLKLLEQIENKKLKIPSKKYLLQRKASFLRINLIFYEETNDKKNTNLINQKIKLVYEAIKDTANLVKMHIDAVWEKYHATKNPNEVYDSLNKKLQLYEKVNAIKYITLYQKEIAGLFDRINLPSKMVEYDEKYLATTIKLKDTLAIVEAYLNTAHAHRYNHEPQKALEYSLVGLKLIEKTEDKQKIGFTLLTVASAYTSLHQYDKALEYSNKGLKIGAELKDSSLIDQVYFWQIGIYQSLKDYPKAIELAKKRYDWSLHVNNKFDAQQMAHLLARLNIDLNNYTNALKYVLIADTLLYKSNDLLALREGYRLKFKIYNRNKDFEKALYNHLKFRELDDSVQKRENHAGFEQKETIALFERNEAIKKEEQEKKDVIASKEKQQQKVILWFVFGGLILVATFSIMMFNRFRVTKKQNTIIGLQKQEVESQKHLVEEKQKEILDSIHYAKRLQEAILPPLHFINEHAPNNFVLYQPKDVVAGDFYWAEIKDDKFFIAAADSTGHGVPGAMVSVVCSNALNRTLNEFGITDTGKILDKTRELVLETFAKGNSEVKDGMDISLLCIDKQNNKAFWSGANNPLWYVKSSVTSSAVEKSTDTGLDSARPDIQIIELKADKQPIGKTEITKPFTAHEIGLQDGMQFYLFTDGFADQFGGPKGKKFMYKQLENLLISISHESMEIQKQKLENVFENWKGDLEQVDDVCVIGVKI